MNRKPPKAASPYSTGGGGVNFEQRLAAVFLARMLTSTTVGILADTSPESVAFQQSPSTEIDDLVLTAIEEDGISEVSLEIAVRRKPKFVPSDDKTVKLVAALVREDIAAEQANSSPNLRRLGIAVSGRQTHVQELAELAVAARSQSSSKSFFELVRTPKKFASKSRLEHFLKMVSMSLEEMDADDVGSPEHRCWSLLTRLWTLQIDLEPGNEGDWTAVIDLLKPIAIAQTQSNAVALRNRLEQLAGEFSTNAALLDRAALRRHLHGEIDPGSHAPPPGWDRLALLDRQARIAIGRRIEVVGLDDLKLPRQQLRDELSAAIRGDESLLLRGDSGVGKSALVMDEVEPEKLADDLQVVVVNLRQLPRSELELLDLLKSSFVDLLREMSAPVRLLVIDGAEAAAEDHGSVFSYLLDSAEAAGVRVLSIATSEGVQATREFMRSSLDTFRELLVPGLDDDELALVEQRVPVLHRLLRNERARELLRRPIIVELLGRAGSSKVPLSEAQALDHIWHHLVRNEGRHDAGSPDAREKVMLSLAAHEVSKRETEETLGQLDHSAVDGLRRSGMLLPASRLPWQLVPSFKHDLLRSYATARWLLLDRTPAEALENVGAPRWILPSARLACEILLTAPDDANQPHADRFASLQAGFDRIASLHGERWSDVPFEALLSAPNSTDLLGEAWPRLTSDRTVPLNRLVRVARAWRAEDGFLDPVAVEPFIDQLLSGETPLDEVVDADDLFREWLQSALLKGTPAGSSTRVKLRETIRSQIEDKERELDAVEAEREATLAARTTEEIAADEKRKLEFDAFRAGMISRRHRRRTESERHRPHLWIRDSQIEQLALLGPDIGECGESILRRISEDDPGSLENAVETVLAGQSLSSYDVDLLADLTAAYYIEVYDDDEYDFGGASLLDDGIRNHRFAGLRQPLASYSHGPFISLFRTGYRKGINLLNRMLLHAAKNRISSLKSLPLEDGTAEKYAETLSISGEPRSYVGDGHVWLWYRGTGVGPYPCMSALQALEFVTEEFIRLGVATPQELCGVMIEEAETLAMPALALGILVRHLEDVGDAIDPYLVEPAVWQFEFSRALNDQTSGLASRIPELPNPERRKWSLREVGMTLTLQASGERLSRLEEVGNLLQANAREQVGSDDSDNARTHLASVRNWAAVFDRDSYHVRQEEGQIVIQQSPDPQAAKELEASNRQIQRIDDALGLTVRHAHVRDSGGKAPQLDADELASDIGLARELLKDPPDADTLVLDGPIAVAATVIELHFTSRAAVSSDDLFWGGTVVQQMATTMREAGKVEFDESMFSQGADRSTARALPFLLLPQATELRARLSLHESENELMSLSRAVAVNGVKETRLFYSQSLDVVWNSPCDVEHLGGRCHHEIAFDLVIESLVPSRIGSWNNELQRRSIDELEPPEASSLDNLGGKEIIVGRLTSGIRALGSAAAVTSCVRERAREALASTLAAHQRAMLAHEHGYTHSDSDSLVAARASLRQAVVGHDELVLEYIRTYLPNPRMLSEGLRALNAAAEEQTDLGEQARRLWPTIIDLVLDAAEEDRELFDQRRWGDYAESSLIPNPTGNWGYLTAERSNDPQPWRDLLSWAPQVDRWLDTITRSRMSIDNLVIAVGELEITDQINQGLHWIERVVSNSGDSCATTFTLPEWLHERRPDLVSSDQVDAWMRIVDMLIVAGDRRVADLAD